MIPRQKLKLINVYIINTQIKYFENNKIIE